MRRYSLNDEGAIGPVVGLEALLIYGLLVIGGAAWLLAILSLVRAL